MPLGLSDARENTVIDHIFRNAAFTPPTTVYVALHTAYPGDTGASEVAGGSYARQALELDAAAAGASQNTNIEDFVGMPAVTGDGVWGVSIWDAVSAGNCMATAVMQPAGGHRRAFSGNDVAGDTISSATHGLTTDDRVVFLPLRGAVALPAGITEGTLYFVRSGGLTVDAFTFATTSGGAAVNITAVGTGVLFKVTNKIVNVGDTLRLPVGDLDFFVD